MQSENFGKALGRKIYQHWTEEEWIKKLGWLIDEIKNKQLTFVIFIFGDPLFTSIQKEFVLEAIEFLSNYYPEVGFNLCFTNTRELTNKEKTTILKEAHSTHMGKKNTLDRAKKLGHWVGMDDDIIKYVKSCAICQLQKIIRITNQVKGIIPATPTNLNEKIAIDIFGPLPETRIGNKYILSIQDRLTRYIILLPMKNETLETIIKNLIEDYIYTFGAPKTVLTDQGQNLVAELIQRFEKALRIYHTKTTAFYPQGNGNVERMHSTLKNLIKTSITENNKQ